MRVLIVGGTGLISTGITRRLLERGDDVTLYNRGVHDASFAPGVQVILGDRQQFAAFEAQIAGLGYFDAVIDMVCFLPEEMESAIRAFRGRTGQYIFCSTVDVYTRPASRYPIVESESRHPLPSYPYAYAKAHCEELVFAAHARGELNATIIRPGHTIGEGRAHIIHSMGASTHLLDRIRKSLPIICHGDGSSFWGTAHRDDVSGAFVGALGNPQAYGKGYHAASDEMLTWDRYYQGIAEGMGWPAPKLVHIPTELLIRVAPQSALWTSQNFCYNNVFDNTAAKADLGYRFTIPWVESSRRIIQWLIAHDQIEDTAKYPVYDAIIAAWERHGAAMADELAGLDQ